MKVVSVGAWLFTFVWAGIVGWMAFCQQGEFAEMKPNEWGDFLAGTVSPLALIWLVAGYLQQGKELKLNTEALLLQQRELANQVAATNQLAIHAEQQASASVSQAELAKLDWDERKNNEALSHQPVFEFSSSDWVIDGNLQFRILNKGKDAFDVEVASNDYSSSDWDAPTDLAAGQLHTVIFMGPKDEKNLKEFNVEVNYMDWKGFRYVQHYLIKNGKSTFKNIFPVG